MASNNRVSRSVRLTPEVNERLLALCGHLGVNPNAYLVAEIGKAISRDEVAFKAAQMQRETMLSVLSSLEAHGESPVS